MTRRLEPLLATLGGAVVGVRAQNKDSCEGLHGAVRFPIAGESVPCLVSRVLEVDQLTYRNIHTTNRLRMKSLKHHPYRILDKTFVLWPTQ